MARPPEAEWDRLARFYDRQLLLERRALEVAVDLAAAGRAEHLLDVGTGTGALLRVLARRRSRPEQAVGVDVSPKMLARVPALPEGWTLVHADAQALPFDDASFDVLTAGYVLHLLGPVALVEVLDEAHRVLVPGGRLVAVTPARPRSVFGAPYGLAATALRRLFPGVCAGLRPLDPRPALRRAGFDVRRTEHVAWGYPSICVLAVRWRR